MAVPAAMQRLSPMQQADTVNLIDLNGCAVRVRS
jgi:hypothetical protein